MAGNWDAQPYDQKMKNKIANNLNKTPPGLLIVGRHPWIRLVMESERMLEKGINFIFCLGTAYGISSMESVHNSKSFSLVGWIHLPKCFYL